MTAVTVKHRYNQLLHQPNQPISPPINQATLPATKQLIHQPSNLIQIQEKLCIWTHFQNLQYHTARSYIDQCFKAIFLHISISIYPLLVIRPLVPSGSLNTRVLLFVVMICIYAWFT